MDGDRKRRKRKEHRRRYEEEREEGKGVPAHTTAKRTLSLTLPIITRTSRLNAQISDKRPSSTKTGQIKNLDV